MCLAREVTSRGRRRERGKRIVVFEREMERENKADRWRKERKMGGWCMCVHAHMCVTVCVLFYRPPGEKILS